MCNEMKGNIFALFFLISHKDIVQYAIHTLLLFILFFYWEMLKNFSVLMNKHTEEAIVSSDGICHLMKDSTNYVKAQR